MSEKRIIQTSDAPAAIGPYSQAVSVGTFVFCSGQIPLDPQTGELVGEGDVTAQCHQVLKNLDAVIKAANSDFNKVVKTTIFLKSMNDFAAVNEVYAKYFEANAPARATVEVSRLPKDVLVEIDAIALVENN